MLAKNKNEFIEFFAKTVDCLIIKYNIKQDIVFYPTIEIIFLILVAMLSGSENCDAIIYFGEKHLDLLKKYLPFKNSIPKIIINRLFHVINNKSCDKWLNENINFLLTDINEHHNNETAIQSQQYISCGITVNGLCFKLANHSLPSSNIINYINLADTDIIIIDNTIEIQLPINANNYQVANNMLILRNMVFDIIKQYRVKKCSKLGINAIRRLASKNHMKLVDILNNWIYDNDIK